MHILNVKQVANYLQVSEKTVYRYVAERKIPFVKHKGCKLFFIASDIDEWIRTGMVNSLGERYETN